jgi:UDP-3-O-[3-hydroxymyristoyl] glucosamine N-acyltransferase
MEGALMGKLEINQDSFKLFLDERGMRFAGSLNRVNELVNVKPIEEALSSDITFCRFEGKQGLKLIKESSAGLIFIPHSLLESFKKHSSILISCEFPRLEMLKFLSKFWNEPNLDDGYVSNNDVSIHKTAYIASGVRIGQFSVIGPGVKINKGAQIGSNNHIENAEIGVNAKIASNVTIGGSGFGFENDPVTKETLEFPHIGGIRIGNNVSIGSSTCIDRGGLGDTVIGDDVKIDNLVHISHNVKIGNRCKVIALSMIGGSVVIGDDCWISPSSAIRDWRKIGDGALVGLGAVVTKDIESNDIVIGNPAKPLQKKVGRYK